MTEDDLAFLADLAASRAGLRLDVGRAYLVESRLAPAGRRETFGSVDDFVQALRADNDERLLTAAVEALGASETRFFRDPEIFERLWLDVVPELARRRPDGAVRIWSAGCSTGQEIYSLAMLQAEQPAPTGKVELFASDLSERLLERARAGLYSSFEVQRGLSARRLVRHFENRDDQFQLARRVRQAVRWRRVNLLDDLSPLGTFDVVLCRNVLSGLAAPARERVLESLAGVVAPGGVLILGLNEAAASEKFAALPAFEAGFSAARDASAAA
jgi:chemotaxis protein methyltransferase CheR